jgi:16S rRNA (cytidine1402-2'-O)-methyltransferase
MTILSIVATPIGNLRDITLRSLDVFDRADIVLCEDTRVTKQLFDAHSIQRTSKQFVTLNEHSLDQDFDRIIESMISVEHVVLVSDAGTPGISDPGGRFISYVRRSQYADSITIVPVPGVSALSTLLSVAGIFAPQGYYFMGFPPHKKGRKTFLEKALSFPGTLVVLFESNHRIEKCIAELLEIAENPETVRIFVGREMTKMHEQYLDVSLAEYRDYLKANPVKTKGEFCLGIYHTV